MSSRRSIVCVALALSVLTACSDPPTTPEDTGGVDAGRPTGDTGIHDDAGTVCTSDLACDDGSFCDGIERCAPDAGGANARGCVSGPAACASGETCDEAADVCNTGCPDADHDGQTDASCGGGDCDDGDPARSPANTEVCDAAGLDEDCDPTTFGTRDADTDGHVDATCCNGTACGDDCDDSRPDVYGGLVETCDGRDNDCDSSTDEGVQATFRRDADGDGYASPTGVVMMACSAPSGYATTATDCDDTSQAVNPATTEVCANGVDDNCNGAIDERGAAIWYADTDGDGFGDPGATMTTTDTCTAPVGYVGNARDCNDAVMATHPGATETCDGLDDDCSLGIAAGGIDASEDRDGDHHAPLGAACSGGYPTDDCNDARLDAYAGAPEVCDGLDDDCSSGGGVDSSEDVDGDGHSSLVSGCAGGAYPRNDCNDGNPSIYGGALELCDRLDNDCTSGGNAEPAEDVDGDGHAPLGTTICVNGTLARDDCDDTRATVYPGAAEICDARDSDCSSGGGALTAEDADGDAHSASTALCAGGYPKDDCDDSRASVHPGATELCDALDTDCSTGGGALSAEDADADMHSPSTAACSGGYPRDDCDDSRTTVHPGATEACDGRDSDCSSGGGALVAEDVDGDLHSAPGAACTTGPYPKDDCDDSRATVYTGATEICDGRDDDCSSGGGALASEDADGDMHAAPAAACAGGPFAKDDCDDTNANVFPGAPVLVPRPISPSNGAITGVFGGAARPTFRWRASGSCGPSLSYELQVDDSCALGSYASCTFPSPELAMAGIATTSYRPATGLVVSGLAPVGRRYYWRARACDGVVCSAWSSVWYVDVGRGANDFDGDGFSDVAISATYVSTPAAYEGAVFVYRGANTLATTPSATLANPTHGVGGHFGQSVGGVGDLNADGFADLVVGAYTQDGAATTDGAAYVYYGGAAGLPSAPSRTLVSPMPETGGQFGAMVGPAGDIDGDGYADLVVAAPNEDSLDTDTGNVYLYFGSATGVAASPDLILPSPSMDISGHFAASACAADFDADGYPDLVLGVPQHDTTYADAGIVYLFPGGPSGPPTAPAQSRSQVFSGNMFYGAVSCGADANGDGYPDLLVGASGYMSSGAGFVYHGGPLGLGASPAVTLREPPLQASAGFGGAVVLADFDHDGFADALLGALYQDAGRTDEGNAFLFAGSSAGIATTPLVTIDSPLNQSSAYFGNAVACPGDLDGDGYLDAVIGAFQADVAPATNEGNAYFFHGGATSLPTTPTLSWDEPAHEGGAAFGTSICTSP